jgi:glycosyltransferase involved in cell wall biosynthesis
MRYSIITINYNDKEGLIRTIKSVINQTSKDFEYIVIDGGSTDGSVDIIKQNADHINYWVSEKDKGVYNAMNKGIAQAKGDYLVFMNAGDCFHTPDILELMCDYQEDIICGKVFKGNTTIPSGHCKPTITLVDLMRGSLPHQAMFIRRELMVKHPYDENYKILSDWKFCIQALVFDNCTFRNSDVVVADYDISGISTNSNGLLPKEREQILKEIFPPRIIADYQRLYPVDDELLEQSLLLTQTVGARNIVKRFSNLIIHLINKK